MDTYLWRHNHPRDGRVATKDDFTEAEALRIFRDAERIEGSRLAVEPSGHIGWGFASGLVPREDGAMMQPEPRLGE